MPESNRAVLQGTVDLLILKTLSWGPRHGYAIARWIEETTDDVLRRQYAAIPYSGSGG
jgi:DNA-binding PadR family transcriptional regulator